MLYVEFVVYFNTNLGVAIQLEDSDLLVPALLGQLELICWFL